MKPLTILIFALSMMTSPLYAAPAAGRDFNQTLLDIQTRWAQINYTLKEDEKESAFEKLAAQAERFAKQYPESAEPLVWQGIVVSTWAGAKGGLGALGLVKQARALFEKSLKIDEQALEGSAYTSLGSLYYQVPGWPIGFGDDEKARDYLQKAVRINPNGIDANYFYADFLIDQGEYKEATTFLQNALKAPARPQRPLADKGRRDEIRARLAMVQQQTAKAEQKGFY